MLSQPNRPLYDTVNRKPAHGLGSMKFYSWLLKGSESIDHSTFNF